MTSRIPLLVTVVAVIGLVTAIAVGFGQHAGAAPNDTIADLAIGQPNLTSNAAACFVPSASTLCQGGGIAFDPLSGALYVAVTANNRVLEFDTPLTNQTAQRVFGQYLALA